MIEYGIMAGIWLAEELVYLTTLALLQSGCVC